MLAVSNGFVIIYSCEEIFVVSTSLRNETEKTILDNKTKKNQDLKKITICSAIIIHLSKLAVRSQALKNLFIFYSSGSSRFYEKEKAVYHQNTLR